MATQTPRLKTPYIISTQSQKEVTHNSALNMLDALVQPAVETSTLTAPPASPVEGNLWIVASSAAGAWAGFDNDLAQFIGGSWQFFTPFEGMSVWLKDDDVVARYRAGLWQKGVVTATRVEISGQQIIGAQQGAILDPSGGTTIDAAARSALNSLLAACRSHGLIAP